MERGAGTIEYIGLTALLVIALSVALGSVLGSDGAENRMLASRIAIKIRCAARLPEPCWRDPLTDAYGRPVAGLVRAWASQPQPIAGLVPVDPRRCRNASCAIAAGPRLTSANRRITLFSRVTDRRRSDSTVEIEYLAYRPTLGWSITRHLASTADVEAHAKTPLLDATTPQVIPIESSWTLSREIAVVTSGRGGTP